MVLERYDPLVDDVAAFRAACERRLPSVVRVNTVKTSVDRARRALDDDGHDYEQADWYPELLRLDSDSPGTSWPYFHGWLYGQEEVSALPALVCAPEPDERVLDPCAAPGSKTTQLAAMMDDTGTLVANDNNLGRLSALRSNAERCGVTNLVVTNQDARNLSLGPFTPDEGDGGDGGDDSHDGQEEPLFDRALVDVPCSCEGTIRKNPDALDEWSLGRIRQIASVQRDILRRAIQTTRPGGTVVYSTCTFAPEENEAVLDHVLGEEPCELVEFDVPLDTRPGVTEWKGDEYDPSVERAKRVWPHLNDTGGFFCAKLEVTG
ncbi:RsmB/NOP family class I SAM-dependent RNA methyltransferase [Halomarina salina]|uniref:RsmB/NOP family class I SAM-dependent RNA methyltransferase n=1 Tax=Halomarina salina TaxID=1872699 RepID=A0ABD5RJU9_9EURY|nr:RsmB/NOP family class I SAM-dependent RNA methyltransferase [Halomarina salina]